jgi:phage tail sheath protein FI
MTAEEADDLIARSHRILAQWQKEIDHTKGEWKAEAISARDSVLQTLREIAIEFPDKAERVKALLDLYKDA